MNSTLQPTDLAAYFASLDRRLDERAPAADDGVDETARDVAQELADLDKRLVLLGLGEGDLEQPIGQRLAERLRRVDDEAWSKPYAPDSPDRDASLLEHVRAVVDRTAAALRG